jgi:hypothetical protein
MEIEEVAILLPDAEKFALENDRAKYQPYFECAEKFCAENKIIIGGKAGLALLTRKPLSKDSWTWDLYCPDTFAFAKKLTDALFAIKSNHIDGRTITLQTNIKYREFTIAIETRSLFKVYALDKYRDVVLTDLMEPEIVEGWFGSQVRVIPRTMALIELYQILYSPTKCKYWEDALGEVRTLSVPGARTGSFDRAVADEICLRTVLKDRRIVLVGDYAAARLGIGRGTRLQILTDIPIEELTAMFSRALSAERDQLRRVKVSHERTVFVKYNLNIPSDFQITKHTIYAVKGEQIALADVFNSPTYELIPFSVVDKLQIAAPFVLLRFIYIDIWVVKLITSLGNVRRGGADNVSADNDGNSVSNNVSTETASADNDDNSDGNSDGNNVSAETTSAITGGGSRIDVLTTLANRIRDYIESNLETDPFIVFKRDYIGVNTSEIVAKKKIIASAGYRIPNYYPAAKSE